MARKAMAYVGAVAITAIGAIPLVGAEQATDNHDGQAASEPPSRRTTSPLTESGVPDLSGVWVFRTATPLQRPEALKDKPFLTDAEVAQLRERARRLGSNPDNDAPAGDQLYLAVLADVKEFRSPNSTQSVGLDPSVVDRDFDNRTSLVTDPPDGRIPPLTSEGQRRQAANAARSFNLPAGPRDNPAADTLPVPAGPEELANPTRCITWGVPRLGGTAFFTSHFQIVQSRDHIAIVQEVNHDVRIIPLDGRAPLSPRIRQWNGASRGRWEGQTLVVETANLATRSFFLGSTENLQLVERFTRSAPDTLDYEVTITDPTTWMRPWTARVPLRRSQDLLYEFACHEGNYHTIRGILGAARAREGARPD